MISIKRRAILSLLGGMAFSSAVFASCTPTFCPINITIISKANDLDYLSTTDVVGKGMQTLPLGNGEYKFVIQIPAVTYFDGHIMGYSSQFDVSFGKKSSNSDICDVDAINQVGAPMYTAECYDGKHAITQNGTTFTITDLK